MQNTNNFFGTHNGSENYYRHNLLKNFIYTNGVKEMVVKCQSYWLIDLIISHQLHDVVKKEPFQVWDLQRMDGNQFIIVATDGNHNKVTSQEIPFSDFPYDLATLWLVDSCIMLPCEY